MMTMKEPRHSIRHFQDDDEMAVVRVWHRSGLAAYTYLPTWQAFTIEHARTVFHDVIRARCTIWVGLRDEHIVAYMAMNGSCIDRLYVDPTEWRMGWGTRLLSLAKTISPHGLDLYTHQANHAARALYEKHGFRAVAFGTSPPPESAPDVAYHWRPQHCLPIHTLHDRRYHQHLSDQRMVFRSCDAGACGLAAVPPQRDE